MTWVQSAAPRFPDSILYPSPTMFRWICKRCYRHGKWSRSEEMVDRLAISHEDICRANHR